MKWGHFELLYLALAFIPVGIAILVTARAMRKKATRVFSASAATRALIGNAKTPLLRAVKGTLLVLGLFGLILALARPKYGSHVRTIQKRGVDVVIALDFSKSMLARDVRPSRIDRAKAELSLFLAELTGDRVGIVAFAGETMEFPLTSDYQAIELFFRDMGPYDMPVGGTAIGRGLISAKRLLVRASNSLPDDVESDRAQVVILITDGEDHEGDPIAAAEELAEAGIRVYTIGIGSSSGEKIPTYDENGHWTGYLRDRAGEPVLSALTPDAEQQLQRIADTTDGSYFRAQRGTVGMDEIRSEIRNMKQRELSARQVTDFEDRYALVLFPAFLLILLEALLPETWWRRRRRTNSREAKHA